MINLLITIRHALFSLYSVLCRLNKFTRLKFYYQCVCADGGNVQFLMFCV